MKRITSNSELIDAWASQDRQSGRLANMSFDGPLLFSYDTPVARIAYRASGVPAPSRLCLTIYRRYSATTSGHVTQARGAAAREGLHVIAVATIDQPIDHARNLHSLANDVLTHLRKARKARQFRASHDAQARKRVLEFNMYSKFFELGHHIYPDDGHLAERVEDFIGTPHCVVA